MSLTKSRYFTFVVYYEDLKRSLEKDIIVRLKEQGFVPLVEGNFKKSKEYFKRNCIDQHLLFSSTGTAYTFQPDEKNVAPVLGAFLQSGPELNNHELSLLEDWVQGVVFKVNEDDVTEDVLEFGKGLGRPEIAKDLLAEEKVDEKKLDNDHYEFWYDMLPMDMVIYQVNKPFTDRPYTTVTKKFSEKGHLPFFSSLFICPSWGVSSADIAFLKQIWDKMKQDKEKGVEGDFNIEKLVSERVKACTQGMEAEPEVWRNDKESVKRILEKRLVDIKDDDILSQEPLLE